MKFGKQKRQMDVTWPVVIETIDNFFNILPCINFYTCTNVISFEKPIELFFQKIYREIRCWNSVKMEKKEVAVSDKVISLYTQLQLFVNMNV